jgi:polyribonucleotide nucleotidyltransferase
MIHTVTIPFGEGREIILETGRIARQAHGTVMATIGGTVVMANVVRSAGPMQNADFFPLTVDYREKHYAAGRIPGNFFRREGRPGTAETINARLVDRSIRPLFPDGFFFEVQVFITVLSMDQINPPAIPSLVAASAALSISDIPFLGPVGAARVAKIDDRLVLNPSFEERVLSNLDLVVAGTHSAFNMVESGSNELTEAQILEAMKIAKEQITRVTTGIDELVAKCGKEKISFTPPSFHPDVVAAANAAAAPFFEKINLIVEKKEREAAVDAAGAEVLASVTAKFAPAEGQAPIVENLGYQIKNAFEEAYKKNMRRMVLETKRRADGRALDEIRPIDVEVSFLPMTHGSAVFTRGQTQSLGVTTLGTIGDQQKIDDLQGTSSEHFMLHYNFPSYSVGEVRRISGPGRRELGHGMLAQRSLEPMLPAKEKFPYTIRVVSEILESNGSSSMASVCSGCLSLLDAGVPMKAPVAGIAMGLISEGDKVAILTDIMGLEDHLGDMDFKVAGTREGITALQMDIKMEGLNFEILETALAQAKTARCFILDRMATVMPSHRDHLSPLAPRIETMQINPERIGDLIGPSGKHIRGICEATSAKIDVEEDGTVYIATADGDAMAMARQMVSDLTSDAEINRIYKGKVVRVVDFGCFVEFMPKKEGLVHISELDNSRVEKVEDICREGDQIKVKVVSIDDGGKIRLSRRQALDFEIGTIAPAEPQKPRPERGNDDRGDRGDRGSRDRGGSRDRDRGGRDRGGRDRS